jgi:hypothetical protein
MQAADLARSEWRSLAYGIALGFAASLVLLGTIEALRQAVSGFADSGAESALALLAIPCYFVAGWFATGSEASARAARGALAGVGVAVLGLIFSLLIWVLFRGGPWLTGARAQHPAFVVADRSCSERPS